MKVLLKPQSASALAHSRHRLPAPTCGGLQGHDAGSSRWAEASEQVTLRIQESPSVLRPHIRYVEENSSSRAARPRRWKPCAKSGRLEGASSSSSGDSGRAAPPRRYIPDSFVDEVVYPGFPVKVFNSIGAGDGFMSGFLRGWSRVEDLASCRCYATPPASSGLRLGRFPQPIRS